MQLRKRSSPFSFTWAKASHVATVSVPSTSCNTAIYASMTCSHCAEFHNTTFQKIKKDYIETGEVRYIFREFPIDKLAMATSMLARCVDKNVSLPFLT